MTYSANANPNATNSELKAEIDNHDDELFD